MYLCPMGMICSPFQVCQGSYRSSNAPTVISHAELNLNNELRMLWEQHSVWTRMTIMGIVENLPDVDLITQRLLRNPKDFGEALLPFYGSNLASQFADLLTDHLVIAAELVKAAKVGDNRAAAEAEERWYANADEIAGFLGRINPYWSQEDWRLMLHDHLGLVKAQAVNLLTKEYAAGIEVYDRTEEQALMMADVMVKGIVRQFPNMFR